MTPALIEYERVLKDGGLMRVFMSHNKDFPEKSARPYTIAVINPRSGESFEVALPETCKKGTLGYDKRARVLKERIVSREDVERAYRISQTTHIRSKQEYLEALGFGEGER